MQQSLNTTYVKKFDENGVLTNPIPSGYGHVGSNRKARRKYLQKDRFVGQSKNHHLTVVGTVGKYHRRTQFIHLSNGKVKTINHYDLINMRISEN
jgi:hypothetical protein